MWVVMKTMMSDLDLDLRERGSVGVRTMFCVTSYF